MPGNAQHRIPSVTSQRCAQVCRGCYTPPLGQFDTKTKMVNECPAFLIITGDDENMQVVDTSMGMTPLAGLDDGHPLRATWTPLWSTT